MPLDLSELASQIETMAAELAADEQEREARLERAWQLLRAETTDLDRLRSKIEASRTTWLVATPAERLDRRHPPPSCPSDFIVLASDGSHIDVDRHGAARCYLINLGTAILRYGNAPDAALSSHPTLYASERDLTIADPVGSGDLAVEGALLAAKRSVEECRALLDLCRGLPPDLPAVALLDGSLILWGLAGQAQPEYVREELLERGLLQALDALRDLGSQRTLALASYISFPRSTDVVNLLRLLLCPHEVADCDRFCPRSLSTQPRPCDAVAAVSDRALFGRLLQPGERSAAFVSSSSVVRKHYREHEVRFCYLNVGDELARVEFPRWVEERGLLDLAHAVLLEQCHLGQGYPVALSEAHEKAVLTAADREQFQQLVEAALAGRRLSVSTSAKSRSKRTRWV